MRIQNRFCNPKHIKFHISLQFVALKNSHKIITQFSADHSNFQRTKNDNHNCTLYNDNFAKSCWPNIGGRRARFGAIRVSRCLATDWIRESRSNKSIPCRSVRIDIHILNTTIVAVPYGHHAHIVLSIDMSTYILYGMGWNGMFIDKMLNI